MHARVILFGLGSIGREIARLAMERGMEIVAAVDMDPMKIGKRLGDFTGMESGVAVSSSLDDALAKEADIVVNSTVSALRILEPDIIKCVKAGKNFISTCEELVYPYAQHKEIANRIDILAREKCVSVLGIGVNPGFVMDRLVLSLAGTTKLIRKVKVTRIVNTSERRLPLQKKTGAGMSVQEFEEGVKKGVTRHVGMLESAAIIADGLGLELDGITESIEPVVADREIESEYIRVARGKVSGLRQVCRGMKGGDEIIRLELGMHLGAEAYDRIEIEGVPRIDLKIDGGIHGDLATVGIVVNHINKVINASPGLLTVKDMA